MAMIPKQKPEESLPELSHRVEEHYNFKKHIIEWESAETADSENRFIP